MMVYNRLLCLDSSFKIPQTSISFMDHKEFRLTKSSYCRMAWKCHQNLSFANASRLWLLGGLSFKKINCHDKF